MVCVLEQGGTKLFTAVALQELSLTHLWYGPINLKLGVFN